MVRFSTRRTRKTTKQKTKIYRGGDLSSFVIGPLSTFSLSSVFSHAPARPHTAREINNILNEIFGTNSELKKDIQKDIFDIIEKDTLKPSSDKLLTGKSGALVTKIMNKTNDKVESFIKVYPAPFILKKFNRPVREVSTYLVLKDRDTTDSNADIQFPKLLKYGMYQSDAFYIQMEPAKGQLLNKVVSKNTSISENLALSICNKLMKAYIIMNRLLTPDTKFPISDIEFENITTFDAFFSKMDTLQGQDFKFKHYDMHPENIFLEIDDDNNHVNTLTIIDYDSIEHAKIEQLGLDHDDRLDYVKSSGLAGVGRTLRKFICDCYGFDTVFNVYCDVASNLIKNSRKFKNIDLRMIWLTAKSLQEKSKSKSSVVSTKGGKTKRKRVSKRFLTHTLGSR